MRFSVFTLFSLFVFLSQAFAALTPTSGEVSVFFVAGNGSVDLTLYGTSEDGNTAVHTNPYRYAPFVRLDSKLAGGILYELSQLVVIPTGSYTEKKAYLQEKSLAWTTSTKLYLTAPNPQKRLSQPAYLYYLPPEDQSAFIAQAHADVSTLVMRNLMTLFYVIPNFLEPEMRALIVNMTSIPYAICLAVCAYAVGIVILYAVSIVWNIVCMPFVTPYSTYHKSRILTFILYIIWPIPVYRMYLGCSCGSTFFCFITFGGLGLWAIIEGFRLPWLNRRASQRGGAFIAEMI